MNTTLAALLTASFAIAPAAWAQQLDLKQALAVPGATLQVMAVSSAQVKDDLFAGTEKFAQGATDVTEVNLDPKMLGMVPGGKGGDIAHKMNFMVIHTYTYDKPGMYRMEDVDAYRKKLEDGTWSCSIHVKDKDGTTDICSRTAADHESSEMVILTAEPKELTFIHMSGRMSLSDLSHMGNGMGAGSGAGGGQDGLKHR